MTWLLVSTSPDEETIIPVPAASPPASAVLMFTMTGLTLLASAATLRPLALPVEPPPLGRLLPPVDPEPPVDPVPPEPGTLPLGRLPGVNDGWNDAAAELACGVPDGAVSRPSHTPKLPAATTPRVNAVTPRLFQFRR